MIEKTIIDYLENKISYEEFVSNFDEKMFQYFEEKYKKMKNQDYLRFINRVEGFKNYYSNLLKIGDILYRKSEMYYLIYYCMNDENIVENNRYMSLYEKVLQSVQEYLISEETSIIFEKMFEEIPSNLSKTALKKIVKEKCKELFYLNGEKKSRPYWVQDSEWPVRDGKPLKFVKQKRSGERVDYYFVTTDEKEIVITQYY